MPQVQRQTSTASPRLWWGILVFLFFNNYSRDWLSIAGVSGWFCWYLMDLYGYSWIYLWIFPVHSYCSYDSGGSSQHHPWSHWCPFCRIGLAPRTRLNLWWTQLMLHRPVSQMLWRMGGDPKLNHGGVVFQSPRWIIRNIQAMYICSTLIWGLLSLKVLQWLNGLWWWTETFWMRLKIVIWIILKYVEFVR